MAGTDPKKYKGWLLGEYDRIVKSLGAKNLNRTSIDTLHQDGFGVIDEIQKANKAYGLKDDSASLRATLDDVFQKALITNKTSAPSQNGISDEQETPESEEDATEEDNGEDNEFGDDLDETSDQDQTADQQDNSSVATEQNPINQDSDDEESAVPATPTGEQDAAANNVGLGATGGAAQSGAEIEATAEKLSFQEAAARWIKQAGAKSAVFFKKYYWIVIAVLILLIFVGLFAYWYIKSTDGSTGITAPQYMNPISDKDVLRKFRLLSGDKDVQTLMNNEFFGQAKTKLVDLREAAGGDPVIVGQIDKALQEIDQVTRIDQFKNKEHGEQAITDIESSLAYFDETYAANTPMPPLSGGGVSPLDAIKDYNNILHLGTPLRTDKTGGAGDHGTFFYPLQGKSDATDLKTDGANVVKAPFEGDILNISDDGWGHKKVLIKNGKYEILLANLDVSAYSSTTALNKHVTKGQAIAKVAPVSASSGVDVFFIHLEMTYAGVPVVTTALDKALHDAPGNQKSWGEYYYLHIKRLLSIN